MRRKRNWILRRLVLGFALVALVVPSAAMARVDEGISGQPNSASENSASEGYVPFVTDFPKYEMQQSVKAGDFGMPRPTPMDYALQRGDAIELARTHDRNVVSADIENVRLNPRTVSTPEAVSTGFDWGDAGVGAGFVLGLLLIGGAAFYATRQVGKPQTA
jgi:hypothetical protein